MNLKPVGSNMTELEMGGVKILFSYKTPVAAIVDTSEGPKAYQTETKWSPTTSRHITKWLGLHPEVFGAAYKPQIYFDNFLTEVK